MNVDLSELIAAEEAKRNANWDAVRRAKVIEETIRWADSQRAIPRNSKAGCLAEQARKLAQLAPPSSPG
jgi:hypothetical protein